MRSTSAALAKLSHATADPLVRVALFLMALVVAATVFLASSGLVLAFVLFSAAVAYALVAYNGNESTKDLRAPLPDVWNATIDALGENGYATGGPAWRGASDGEMRAGDARIRVERHPGDFTRVRVRVGRFSTDDNARRAGLILESVAKHVA